MDVLDLATRLVAIDSQNPGAGEARIAADIEAFARDCGIAVQRFEYRAGRPNLLLTVDRGPGAHLALCGHLDTKPIGQALHEWRTDPFALTVEDGLAFGLGASDMKGAVAAMLVTLERFRERGPSGALTVLLTSDEEQGSGAGAKALVQSGDLPRLDAMVITEPSGIGAPWEALHLVSRGIACFDVEVQTAQGHSGLSDRLGRNAVLIAADLLTAFESFVPPVGDTGGVPCAPTVNSGMFVSGGVSFGTWPGWCSIGCEIRLVPGMDREHVRGAVEEFFVREAGDRATVAITWRDGSLGWMPAVGLAPDAPVVRVAQEAAMEVLGQRLPVAAYPGGTDASYFMGLAGIPTIASLGPGWLSVAHGANECVGVAQLFTAAELFTALTDRFLADARDPSAPIDVALRLE